MNEPLQQSTAQGLNEADPAEYLTTADTFWYSEERSRQVDSQTGFLLIVQNESTNQRPMYRIHMMQSSSTTDLNAAGKD